MSIQARLTAISDQSRQSTTKRAGNQAETATDDAKAARAQAAKLDDKALALHGDLVNETDDSNFIEDVGSFIGGIFGFGSNKEDLLKLEIQETEAKSEHANQQAKLALGAAARAVRDIRTADSEAESAKSSAGDMIDADKKIADKVHDEHAGPGASTQLNAEFAGAQARTRAADGVDRNISADMQDRAQADVATAIDGAHGKVMESIEESREKLSTKNWARRIGAGVLGGLSLLTPATAAYGLSGIAGALMTFNPIPALAGAGIGELANMADVGGHAKAAELLKLDAEEMELQKTTAQTTVDEASERVDKKDQAIDASRHVMKEIRNRQINRV